MKIVARKTVHLLCRWFVTICIAVGLIIGAVGIIATAPWWLTVIITLFFAAIIVMIKTDDGPWS